VAALAFGPIVSTTMAIRATVNSTAGVARRWVTERAWPLALGCSVAMCALALVLVPRFAFGPALHPGFYQRNAKMKAAAAADAVVPDGVTVSAVNYLGPQLSARDTVLWWMTGGGTAAPWVVADIETPQFTWSFSTVRATSCCTAVGQAAASVPRRPRDERRRPH
jgi:hypothetical protein